MSLLGIHLTTMIGPTVPVPVTADVANAIEQVQVTLDDEQPAGFQLTFRVGKTSTLPLSNELALGALLRGGARVVLILTVGAVPSVLIDGYITRKELNPGGRPGETTLTVTGVDPTFKLDLEERSVEHPAQPEAVIAAKIIASHGLVPMVIPPVAFEVPIPIERVPVQQGTDLQYLRALASRVGHVFHIIPGPLPMMNTGYWGPPVRVGIPQSALTVDMGSFTNVERFDVSMSMDSTTLVRGRVQDRQTGQTLPVFSTTSTRIPLGREPVLSADPTQTRTRVLREPGLSSVQGLARAQAITDASTDSPLTANGTLDTARYGALLQPRGLVGVRGVGDDYNGNWYVKRVTHTMRRGSYRQNFTLTRGELGALLPLVLP